MKKEHISSKKDDVREDYLANRVMAVFVAAVVLLFGLSYLWNAYNVARTFFAALRINTILIWVSAAALAGSLVWLASDLKKGRVKTAAVFNGAMSTVFFAVLLGSLLLIRYNYSSAKRVLYVVIPAIAILHLIYCSYQREFFSLCLTHSAVSYAIWIIAKASDRKLALIAAVAAIAVCGVALLIYFAARKTDGVLHIGKLGLKAFDNAGVSAKAVVAVYGITAVLVAAAYILAAPVAYYILYAVAAFIAGAAVYFTVKLI